MTKIRVWLGYLIGVIIVMVFYVACSLLIGTAVGAVGALLGALIAVTIGAASPPAVASDAFWGVGGLTAALSFIIMCVVFVQNVADKMAEEAIRAAKE
jgi:hypothetical protein